MSEFVLSCPFCGSTALTFNEECETSVMCSDLDCLAQGPLVIGEGEEGRKKARDAWNKRMPAKGNAVFL